MKDVADANMCCNTREGNTGGFDWNEDRIELRLGYRMSGEILLVTPC